STIPREMKTATLLSLLLLPLLLLGCGPDEEGAGTAAPAASRPTQADNAPRHVFFITVDTLRADHMSAYGYGRETSPRLDRLGASGVVFDQAIAQWPKTGSSFAAVFTGRYPQTTGLTHKAALRIPAEYLTLPELFKENGFTTLAVNSNAVLALDFGWNTGFDEYLQTWGYGDFPRDPRKFRQFAHAGKVNELALPLLEKHRKAERLFVWLHYSDPHAPYMLPDGVENPFLNDSLFKGDETVPRKVTRGQPLDGRTDLKYYVAQYDANILVTDVAIQAVLDRIRQLGLLDDSLIVFTADHGESLGEHDSWFEHGPLPYNTTAHVPLFVVGRGLPAGRRVGSPVELVDLYPTLRDLFFPGRKVEGLEGNSLVPLLAPGEPGDAARAGFCCAFSEAGRRPNYFQSVQDGGWKLIYNEHRRRDDPARPGGFELYDLKADPLETKNLATAKAEEVRRLRKQLFAWRKSPRSDASEDGDDAETRKALEALGYIN
ncbi:MAG TPA: sulfatase, partial [Thermoanaerobaculia bacterium]|nr:sulfatase [Thermoanaerobaculia bacterium]